MGFLSKVEPVIRSKGRRVLDREVDKILRDQCRRRESESNSEFRPHKAQRRQYRGQRDYDLYAEVAGVDIKGPRGCAVPHRLMQRVLWLTQVRRRLA